MASIAKVVEIIAESSKGWEDATNVALTEAAATVTNIQEIWVSGMKALVQNNKITTYRVTAKITFLVDRKK
ncbi:MAG: dodecin family protein [Gemmatimonadales bacterium]